MLEDDDLQPHDKVLQGDAAIALWKTGKDTWNEWVDGHQDWRVDFSGVKFGEYVQALETISFAGFRFPSNAVDFSHAEFDNGDGQGNVGDVNFSFVEFAGDVDFRGAQLGGAGGRVYFKSAQFNAGNVKFSRAQFSAMKIDFSEAKFSNGNVDFRGAKFCGEVHFNNSEFGEEKADISKAGKADFSKAEFKSSLVDFREARFNGRELSFERVHFDARVVYFCRAHFQSETVNFQGTEFHGNEVNFREAYFCTREVAFLWAWFDASTVSFSLVKFDASLVDFRDAKLDALDVYFCETQFADGEVNFNKAQFTGNMDFNRAQFGDGVCLFVDVDMRNVRSLRFNLAKWKGSVQFKPAVGKDCQVIDFSSASVGGEFALGSISTSCVIDLRHTKLAHPIDLDKVDIQYRTKKHSRHFCYLRYPVALNKDAPTCFRRLKKLAKDADDHERTLDFFAKEMRSSYGRGLTGWRLFLYLLYDKVSDYGRSISMPTKWLGTIVVLYGLFYFQLSSWRSPTAFKTLGSLDLILVIAERFGAAITFSLAHALPFYFGSRTANTDTMKSLFPGEDIPDYLHWLTISQGMVCGVLLFLIALALRNHFRS